MSRCDQQPCVLQGISFEEKAKVVSAEAVPNGIPSRAGIPLASPTRAGLPLTSLDSLFTGIVQEVETRHSCLQLEVRTLREEMLVTLRRDLLDAIARINSADGLGPSPVRDECCPGFGAKALRQSGVSVVQDSSSKANGGTRLGGRKVSSDIHGAPEKVSTTPLAGHESTTANGSIHEAAPDPTNAFPDRPNLHAFMQAKNWDSKAIATFANNPEAHIELMEASKVVAVTWRQKLNKMVHSHKFDVVVGLAILVNALLMAVHLEYEGEKTAAVLGFQSDLDRWPGADDAFLGLEYIFVIFFLLEVLVRALAMGCHSYRTPMMWLDSVIVAVSVLDLMLTQDLPNVTFLRMLRIAKLARAFRIVRVFDFFAQLRVLAASIKRAMPALGWSVCLLFTVQCIAAIFMTQSLQPFLNDDTKEMADRAQVYTYFGSFMRAFMTMFEITLAAGTWGRCGRTIIHKVGSIYIVFFLGYICFVSFAIIRVISSIFLKETLAAAAKDGDQVMAETNRDPHYLADIRKVFNEMDKDGNGMVTLDELENLLTDPNMVPWMKFLKLNAHEVKGLFVLMDDGDNSINFAEFVAGIMRLKNASKGVDLATVLYENKKILKRVLAMRKEVSELRLVMEKSA